MFFLNRLRHSRRTADAPERRKLRERGAAALEFALIAPFFFLVVFGGIEIGLMFRSHLALEDMSRSAARVASVQRNAPNADAAILAQIEARSNTLNGTITQIVIFSAPTLDTPISDACKDDDTTYDGQCNVYTITNGDIQTFIDNWPADKETGLKAADRAAWSNLGIYVEYDYEYVTGFFDSITLSTSSVEVVELDL